MAFNQISAKVTGLDELIKRTSPDILKQPLRDFFNRAGEAVKNEAIPLTPVDRGRLRSDISHEVDSADLPLWAKIGTNVSYAKPVEFGTGLLSDAPDSKKRRYWPPWQALQPWARRHGFGAGEAGGRAVAYIIWKRGGTKPKRFMRDGFKNALNEINNHMGTLAIDIGKKWKI